MQLIINILSGQRKGTKIFLDPISESDILNFVLEDEEISFEYLLTKDQIRKGYCYAKLYLHEVGFDPADYDEENDQGIKFLWIKQRKLSFNNLFFKNYCGLAHLSIVLSGENIQDEVINFNEIDILASQLSSDRITTMLEYLSSNEAKDIAALARLTKRNSGHKNDKELLTSIIDKIENYIYILKSIIPNIIKKPITKVYPKLSIQNFNKNLYLNHDSIKWLSSNTEQLQQCSKYDNYDIKINNEYFIINKVLVQQFFENTDIYENQVVHGFLKILKLKLELIINEYNTRSQRYKQRYNIDGYFSLFHKINNFQSEINKNVINKCMFLKNEINKISFYLNKNLLVTKSITNTPYFTLKAKNNRYYHTIFQKMIELKKLGNPDWTVHDELNSIRDIPKLFEYYTLLLTKRSVEKVLKDSLFVEKNFNFNEKISEDYINYSSSNYSVDIFYEPKIWSDPRTESDLINYINPESWDIDGNNIVKRDNKFYGTKSRHRSPDIRIRLKKDHFENIIIIDAKYTNDYLSWKTYLPDLAMKYIHGIHHRDGCNNTLALIVLNPSDKAYTRHYLDHDYSIYGSKTIYPSLFNSMIDINKSQDNENNYLLDLNQLIKRFFI